MDNLRPIHRGLDVILSINDNIVGGQHNATLNRTMSPIKVTNKINGEWEKSLSGLKSWTLNCTGFIVKDEEAFQELETKFNEGAEINVQLSDGKKTYRGTALITNFPVAANYSTSFAYTLSLLGVSELEVLNVIGE